MTPPAAVSTADLDEATNRLVRTVDELGESAYAEDSALVGWSRGHVVAHLALHAEALAAALRSLADDAARAALYPTAEDRDAAIEDLAATGPGPLRERLLSSSAVLREVLADLPDRARAGFVSRVPGAEAGFGGGEAVLVRAREVCFHHVDLAAGHGYRAWPDGLAAAFVDSLRPRAADVTLLATDLGRTWHAENARATVSGTASALAWWLSGRGEGADLTCNSGDLPQIGAW